MYLNSVMASHLGIQRNGMATHQAHALLSKHMAQAKINEFTNLVSQATVAEARGRNILHEYAKTVPLDDLAKVLVILQSSR